VGVKCIVLALNSAMSRYWQFGWSQPGKHVQSHPSAASASVVEPWLLQSWGALHGLVGEMVGLVEGNVVGTTDGPPVGKTVGEELGGTGERVGMEAVGIAVVQSPQHSSFVNVSLQQVLSPSLSLSVEQHLLHVHRSLSQQRF